MRVRGGEVEDEIVDLVEGAVTRVERLVRRRRNRVPTLPAPNSHLSRRRVPGVCERGSPAVNGVVDGALGECSGRQELELRRSHSRVRKVDIDVRVAYLP